MKEFVEKLISRFQNERKPIVTSDEDLAWNRAMYSCTKIVNQLAEEYNNEHDDTDYANIELYNFWLKHQWIPVSSGVMPTENEEVMLTFQNSAGIYVGEAIYKNKMFFYVTDTEFGYYEEAYKQPIAWKYKDAPYQPKEGD